MTRFDTDPFYDPSEYDSCFDPITGLLNISGCDHSTWPFRTHPPVGVTQCDAAMNQFPQIPEGILGCSKLRAMVLFWNRIIKIPDSIRLLPELKSLDLRMNPVRFISHRIGEARKLSELHVSGGCLESVPPEIGELNLRYLTLGNELATIPASIARCRSLRMLRLSENRLRDLPPELGDLSNLAELCVDNNLLRAWPDTFRGLRALRWLHAQSNPLRQLPWFVLDLPAMQGLSCCDFLVSRKEARRFTQACAERGVILIWNRGLDSNSCYTDEQHQSKSAD